MSGGEICKCLEKEEPLYVPEGSNRPARIWRVTVRYGSYSAFNGYRFVRSDYSAVKCLRCGSVWRTKAKYVAHLSDIEEAEWQIAHGYEAHEKEMEKLGRTAFEY